MLRVSAVVEKAGIPTVTIVCEGFLEQAAQTISGFGMPNMRCATMPGHPNVQSAEELRKNTLGVTLEAVVAGLTGDVQTIELPVVNHEPREIVFAGTIDEIDEYFYEREWSDGLPFVPPTLERVERFLRYTDLPPDRSFGILLPDRREATVWSVAVNGVMAGCRPEYMPVLVAVAEALSDPAYGVEHSGNTPGSETLIVLDGPIVTELGFNYKQGALRDGFRANTTIGRFLRLYLRNVPGFLPHKTDKGTFGGTWRVVLAENAFVLGRIGWEPLCTDVGIEAGANAVTIARYSGQGTIVSASGATPEILMPMIADAVLAQQRWELLFTAGRAYGTMRPLLILTPILAQTIARGGWSRRDVKRYLFEHCRIPAWRFEQQIGRFVGHFAGQGTLTDMVRRGDVPPIFGESLDPARLVPIVFDPEAFMIAVSGDPARTNGLTLSHNGRLGYPVGKRIRLPKDWTALPKGPPR